MWSFFARDPSKDFPYEIGETITSDADRTHSLWTIHKAKKKSTGEEVSVFVFDIKTGGDTQFDVAKTAMKRLKTLRHPSILPYLDGFESDKVIYFATEAIEPLEKHLIHLSNEGHQRDLYLSWGIFQITRALSFLNNDCNLRHNNVCLSSVFVNSAGEWKLGGLEYVAGVSEGTGLPIKILPALEKYNPPEQVDPNRQRLITKCSTDMWGLGCLIWEAFNGPLSHSSNLRNVEQLPKNLMTVYNELTGPSPGNRPNPADVITRLRRTPGYFKNDLVDALLFLEEIQIKEKNDKSKFFAALAQQVDQFPEHVCRYKVLPQLITAFDYGDAGSAVLAPLFKLGRLLPEAEYQKKIVPCVVKLFTSNDRATRIRLLQQLELFIGHLQSSTVNNQIFPQIAHGFMDTNPTIREQTVKSIIHLAPKLNYNNLNAEVLRHFARLQAKDDQGGIRTNTTVCLGKIAHHLHPQIRQKVLISAFIRAMRDPFPPARNAGILAMAATQQYFLLSEVAIRILPALCQLTADPEKSVRDNTFRTIKGFLGKLEKVSEDPSLRESMEADVNTATPSLSNAAATWAGWAVSAVTSKFYRSHSDTVKSSTVISKSLSKPGSLEQPSSSSISTTTSSVSSMTSLEKEESKGGESVSDYDDHWDTENWGDIETPGQQSSPGELESKSPPSQDSQEPLKDSAEGWDNEDWGSLEEVPDLSTTSTAGQSESWSPTTDFAPVDNPNPTLKYVRACNWGENSKDDFLGDGLSQRVELALAPRSPGGRSPSGWDEVEWEPIDEAGTGSSKMEEARKKREEKKLQRQKELEARRASRLGGGSKLGAKKS